ncbi:hypothetical protein EPN28_03940 [Patescibacteria group bacterium]|nr:MAG: hypothetical protein EPN28_03940 [Patescibacteria group bacterium]
MNKIFEEKYRKRIEGNIKRLLNINFSILKIERPWAVGDFFGNDFEKIFGNLGLNYSLSFARRAMADLAFTDKNGFYYVVDVKTHRLDTKFNMPNLTSVERLARFYEEDANYFSILKVDYLANGTRAEIKKVTFAPIEFFDWSCLTIGTLGWGQIQIANANVVKIAHKNSRKKWMLDLCDTMLDFYPKEIGKIHERVEHFKKVRKFWEKKTS